MVMTLAAPRDDAGRHNGTHDARSAELIEQPVTVPLRRLYLLRHAKSSWADTTLDDHDRPLAPRGEKALARLRRYLSAGHVAPTLVLCSSARRAVMTCEGIVAALPADTIVRIDDGLYSASSGQLLDRLRHLDDETAGVLLIGHNPELQSLAASLVGSGDDPLREQLASAFPTGALVTLKVSGAWADLIPGTAELEDFVVPRELR